MKQVTLFIIFLLALSDGYSQQIVRPLNQDTKTVPLDSMYRRSPSGTLQLPDDLYNQNTLRGLGFRDTMFYSPLYLPVIYTGNMLPRDLNFYSTQDSSSLGVLIPQEQTFAPRLRSADFVNAVRRNYYLTHPDMVKYSVAHFDTIPAAITREDVTENFNPFKELISTETNYSLEAPQVEGVEIRRKYWIFSGEHSLQFSQNYFSDNWHKGGTSNLNINNYHVLRLNYKKDKVKFNNTIEWRLSVYNAPEDSIRKYRIGQDLIRYFGDFGIDAFIKNWSYSANLDVRSQLFNNYAPNSNELRSAFLSPLYVNAGIGLRYTLDKKSEKVRHRRTRINLHLAPISVNYKYVANENVDVTRFGIDEGKRSSFDIGSTITGELIYDFNKYITWTSRLKYFTSYHKVESEFENTLNMALTNAFSTIIYVNLRYDDGVPPDPRFKYLQINQMLSFGLNYKW